MAGTLVSVHLKDFMVYSRCEIYPSNGLNLVIGPNGSGKSAILIALMVGLGGNINDISRQKDLRELIKDDSDSDVAVVKIALQCPDDKGKSRERIITCKIRPERLDYYLDREAKSVKEIREFVGQLNIKPANMCQFLPQERVSKFSMMNSLELFQRMLEAIGQADSVEAQARFQGLQREICRLEETIKAKERSIFIAEKEVKEMKHVSEALASKEDASNKVKALETLHAVATIKKSLQEREFEHRQKAELTKNMTVATEKRNQAKKTVKERDVELKKTYAMRREQVNVRYVCLRLIRNKTNALDQRVQGQSGNVRTLRTSRRKLKQMEEERGKYNVEDLERKLASVSKDHEEKECQIQLVKADNVRTNEQVKRLQKTKSALERKIANGEAKTLHTLRKHSQDAYHALLWIQGNRGEFVEPDKVYPPVCTQLDVKDLRYARHLERVIGQGDLLAFVCENGEDAVKLMNQRKQKFPKINVVHCPVASAAEGRKSAAERRGNADYFFLTDLIGAKCPDAIYKHIVQRKNIDKVPVFHSEDSRYIQDFAREGKQHFVGDMGYTFIKSKYLPRGHYTEETNQLPPDAKYLVDEAFENQDKIELERVKRQIGELEAEITPTNTMEKEMEELLRKRNDLDSQIDNANRLEARIESVRESIDKLAHGEGSDEDLEQALSGSCNELVGLMEKLANHDKDVALTDLKLKAFQKSHNSMMLVEAEEQFNEADIKLRRSKERHDRAEKNLQLQKQYLRKQSWPTEDLENVGELVQALPRSVKDVMSELDLGADSDAKVEESLNEWRQIFSTKEKLINRNLETKLKDKTTSRDKLLEGKKQTVESREATKKELERCRKIIGAQDAKFERLNSRFSQLMRALGYAGELRRVRQDANSPVPFSLEISVSFRAGCPLTKLDGAQQSGGEKAVTTAAFILALQSFEDGPIAMPFVCVDEINQGMDENNEKNVWSLILDSCRRKQLMYFTPTLSERLNIADAPVTIHVTSKGRIKKSKRRRKNRLKSLSIRSILDKVK